MQRQSNEGARGAKNPVTAAIVPPKAPPAQKSPARKKTRCFAKRDRFRLSHFSVIQESAFVWLVCLILIGVLKCFRAFAVVQILNTMSRHYPPNLFLQFKKMSLLQIPDTEMEAQNAEALRWTDAAIHVSFDQARLKDDALWNLEEDEEFLKYLKDPRIKNIEIEGMPLEKWLKGKTETRAIAEKVEWNDWDPNPVHWNKKHGRGLSEGLWNQLGWTVKNVDPAHQERGLPKYLVLQLQQKLSGEAIASKDVGSKQQTQLQQVTQESINESNMVSNLNKTLFSLLSAIIANLRT